MYGPMAGTRINPCVTVLPLASTIWDEEHATSSLVGSGPPGQDADIPPPKIEMEHDLS